MKGFLVEDSSLDKSEENSYIPSSLDWSAWEDKSGKYWKYWEGYKEDPIKKSTYEVVKDFNGDYVLHSYQDNNGDWWERYEPLKSYSV
jgi:hypothetical protein